MMFMRRNQDSESKAFARSRFVRNEFSETDMFEAAKQINELEKDLWKAILDNPNKVRFTMSRVLNEIQSDHKRYNIDNEQEKLLSDICKPTQAAAKSSKGEEQNNEQLIAMLLAIDLDRDLVAAARDEVMKRGKKSTEVLSAYARAVDESSKRVDAAKNAFIKANQALVLTIAERFSHGRMPFPDCVQEGYLGLIKAVNRFDYTRGYKFSTYAAWWIRAAIGRAVESKESLVRIPGSAIRSQIQLKRAFKNLSQKTGRTPTEEEISFETKMGRLKLLRARKYTVSGVYSLDDNVPGSNNMKYIDMLADESTEDPFEKMHRSLLYEEIGNLMGMLTPLEKSIIKQRFGLDDEDGSTLREIGEQYDLSRERVRQIQNKALEKLRQGISLHAA